MATITFRAPDGTCLNSNWATPDDESIGQIARDATAVIAERGAWIVSNAVDDPARAIYFPVGTSVVVEFDGPLIPESLREHGFALGEGR